MTAVDVDGPIRTDTDPTASPEPAHRPAPFRQFLVKVHSRCNLACDYCYVYEHADQSWRTRPMVMSVATMERTADRIAEHARIHGLTDVWVVLHGGGPLLAGPERLSHLAGALRRAAANTARVHLSIQTNGVLLNAKFLDLFASHEIRVGVSVDGTPAAHDRHRRLRNGRGTYQSVRRALELLRSDRHGQLYGGILCVIDLATDPVGTYEALLDFAPPMIDLLLPHATWAARPPAHPDHSGGTPYADWLIAVFDRWYSAPRRETGIRRFEELINLLLGGRGSTEAAGLAPGDLVVIETDGTVEHPDTLKVAFDGAAWTGLNVIDHPFDAALALPETASRQRGLAGLNPTCQECPVVRVCGGGLYAHRYRPGSGFANPSVYCADLRRLIEYVRGRLSADVSNLLGPQ